MNQMVLIFPVLLPILAGLGMIIFKNPQKQTRPLLIESVVLLTSVLMWTILLSGTGRGEGFLLYRMTSDLEVVFRLDGLGMVFAGLVSFLWPLATLYAFEYMEHDKKTNNFFAFYTMTYGVTLGIALAGNLVTLYLFYEVLTLVTFPLVLFYRTPESRRASQMYLFYSISGAACAFIGLVFLLNYGSTTDFTLGGVLSGVTGVDPNLLLGMYVLAFFGFGVKAAVFPMYKWLPAASVAPTPVTALLHAVAVVKSGAFAIIRLTYYSYGADFLRGTWAHYVVVTAALVTIVFGSTMGVKEVHFKKRLAYSTMSNLSYVVLGAVLMCPAGLVAAMAYLVFHALMKICAFFCAGAVMHKANRNYVYELDGLGYKMPVTFTCFLIAGLSLTGLPFFAGFIGKWNLAQAAIEAGGWISYAAIIVLLYSALMTGIYTMTIVVRAFFPASEEAGKRRHEQKDLESLTDPTWRMLLPMVLFAVLIVFFGLYPKPLLNFYWLIAGGGI